MKLYEIDEAIMNCLDLETGEIIDPDQLTELQMQRNRKIENVACWIKNLVSDVSELKAEEKALTERRKAKENKIDALKNWLSFALEGNKFETAKCAVSFRKSTQVVIDDVNSLPNDFKHTKTTVEPDKTLLKSFLKDGGTVEGVHLETSQNVNIK